LLVIADPAVGNGSPSQVGQRSTADLARVLYDDEGMDLTPIPFSGAEAQKVEQYAGPGSRVYTGREASEHHIKTGKLDNFRVIHFATHALISQRKPERSALILALPGGDGEDGFLQAREIYRLKLASDLLVLSACETARGRILAGEGTQGLAHAFFYAGAQSVVASLWKVNDEETATFMGAFYQHLAQRKSKAEALRAAKLDMIRSKSASPRHWASFILIGEAVSSVPIIDRTWRLRYDRLLLLGSAFAALIALTAFVAFRRRAV
jgi:CHAT domain-containing protein